MTTQYDFCYVDQVVLDASGMPTGAHNLYGVVMWLPPAWLAGTPTPAGWYCVNGGRIYECTTPGTTAASGGPTGTGSGITDGGSTWNYIAAASGTQGYWWWGMPETSFGSGGVPAGATAPPLPIAPGTVYTIQQCQAADVGCIAFNIGQVANQAAAGAALGAQWSGFVATLIANLQQQYPAIANGAAFTPTPFNNAMGTCTLTGAV